MCRFIVKMQDYYLEWSTIVDSPVTFGMSLDEFKEYYKIEYGRRGLDDLDERLERVNKNGSSAYVEGYLPQLFDVNRAGPSESELTPDEIYIAYCLRMPIRGGWICDENGWHKDESS